LQGQGGFFVLANETVIRLGAFAAVFVALAAWEALAPRRSRATARWARWPHHLGLTALNALLLRLIFPIAAVGFAMVAEERGWGLFNIFDLPRWSEILIAIVLLDLVIYLQHVIFHAVPGLWRLHRMHHTDLDVDVTTGIRFHPLEILLSMIIKVVTVAAIGAPAVAVVVFEVLLNAAAMFNHTNARLPARLDRILRLLIVTPDMHRVHHSVLREETNSNFGFQLPWWDWFFGTYRAQPSAGHDRMKVGLDILRDPSQLRLDRLLIQPFVEPAGPYPMLGRNRKK
jgi:sterol desaturase/sphingolipid hydroxylase (fatty acid hydroxylase superfamily)